MKNTMKYENCKPQYRTTASPEVERILQVNAIFDNVNQAAVRHFVATAEKKDKEAIFTSIDMFMQRYGHTLTGGLISGDGIHARWKARRDLRRIMKHKGLMHATSSRSHRKNGHLYSQTLVAAQRAADRAGHATVLGYDSRKGWTFLDARNTHGVAELEDTLTLDNVVRDENDTLDSVFTHCQVNSTAADAYVEKASDEDKNELYGLFWRYELLTTGTGVNGTLPRLADAKVQLFGYLLQRNMITLSNFSDYTC